MKTSRLPIFLILLVFTSCGLFGESEPESRIIITTDDQILSTRYTASDELIEIDTTSSNGLQTKPRFKKVTFDLKLESELSAPEYNGTKLQATMVKNDVANSRWLISYNQKGGEYLGSVDVAQLTGNGKNIQLRSNVVFTDSDVNAVEGDNQFVFASLATNNTSIVENEHRSAAQRIRLTGFTLNDDDATTQSLPSFAANSIKLLNDRVYITSGSEGGLSIYSSNLSTQLGFVEINAARWVEVTNQYLAVLAGDSDGNGSGSIILIDFESYEIRNTYNFPGADSPEAKNTFEIVNDLAFIAAGDEGVQIMNLSTGNIITNIPLPNASSLGLSEEVVTTNAVSVDDDKIFISNGEAGIYVAELSVPADEISNNNFSVTMLGKLQFGELESANHISYRNKLLVVAAGLGGVKVVSLTDK